MTDIDLAAIKTELPADARMQAYYYGFDRTGVGLIDAILSAVAVAGKGSHHTESWCDGSEFGYYRDWPGLPVGADSAVDLIQQTAERSAKQVAALLAYIEELEAQVERVRLKAKVEAFMDAQQIIAGEDPIDEMRYHDGSKVSIGHTIREIDVEIRELALGGDGE